MFQIQSTVFVAAVCFVLGVAVGSVALAGSSLVVGTVCGALWFWDHRTRRISDLLDRGRRNSPPLP